MILRHRVIVWVAGLAILLHAFAPALAQLSAARASLSLQLPLCSLDKGGQMFSVLITAGDEGTDSPTSGERAPCLYCLTSNAALPPAPMMRFEPPRGEPRVVAALPPSPPLQHIRWTANPRAPPAG